MRIFFKLQWLFLFHYVINGLGNVQLYVVVIKAWIFSWYSCLCVLFVCVFPAALSYTGRPKSRESDVCKPRLKPRVFRRYCKYTFCENDKDCRKPNEICICDEDCGKLCLNPSKSFRFVFKIYIYYVLLL